MRRHGSPKSGEQGESGESYAGRLARPLPLARWVLALVAVALVGFTAAITYQFASDNGSRLVTEFRITTGIVDGTQGFDSAAPDGERVLCVSPEEGGASECYYVQPGMRPEPLPRVGQRVRILRGFVVDDLVHPEAGRRNSVVAVEILPG